MLMSKVACPPPASNWLTTAEGALPIATRLTLLPVSAVKRDQSPFGSPTPMSASVTLRASARAGVAKPVGNSADPAGARAKQAAAQDEGRGRASRFK